VISPWKAGGTTDADGVGEWDHHRLTEARQDSCFTVGRSSRRFSLDRRDGLSPYLSAAATSPGNDGLGCAARVGRGRRAPQTDLWPGGLEAGAWWAVGLRGAPARPRTRVAVHSARDLSGESVRPSGPRPLPQRTRAPTGRPTCSTAARAGRSGCSWRFRERPPDVRSSLTICDASAAEIGGADGASAAERPSGWGLGGENVRPVSAAGGGLRRDCLVT